MKTHSLLEAVCLGFAVVLNAVRLRMLFPELSCDILYESFISLGNKASVPKLK